MRRLITVAALLASLPLLAAGAANAAPASHPKPPRVICYNLGDDVNVDLGDLLHVDLDLGGLLGGHDRVCVVVTDEKPEDK